MVCSLTSSVRWFWRDFTVMFSWVPYFLFSWKPFVWEEIEYNRFLFFNQPVSLKNWSDLWQWKLYFTGHQLRSNWPKSNIMTIFYHFNDYNKADWIFLMRILFYFSTEMLSNEVAYMRRPTGPHSGGFSIIIHPPVASMLLLFRRNGRNKTFFIVFSQKLHLTSVSCFVRAFILFW